MILWFFISQAGLCILKSADLTTLLKTLSLALVLHFSCASTILTCLQYAETVLLTAIDNYNFYTSYTVLGIHNRLPRLFMTIAFPFPWQEKQMTPSCKQLISYRWNPCRTGQMSMRRWQRETWSHQSFWAQLSHTYPLSISDILQGLLCVPES